MRPKEDVVVALGQISPDQFIALIQRQGADAARHRIVEFRQLALLDHAFARDHYDELARLKRPHRQEPFDGFPRLQVDEIGDVLSLADRGRVRNLVNLQPVNLPSIGEDQQVAVRRIHQEVFDEILVSRSHADAALAAARLAAIGIHRRALQISAVRDGNGDVFDRNQVFEQNLARVLHDLGAALVSVFFLDFLQFFDDQVPQNLL